MKLATLIYDKNEWIEQSGELEDNALVDIVFIFGNTDSIKLAERYYEIKELYPNAHIVGSSSSGNVLGAELSRYELAATAVVLESSSVKLSSIDFDENDDIEALARDLIEKLPREELKHIFVLSDGLSMNGSQLVRGINKVNGMTTVTGGLAGDGARFLETYVIADDLPKQNRVVAVGFYGESLTISSGCFAGWSEFGAERTITKSSANVVYEIDGEPALDLYKRYLGDDAAGLPNSGLRFPLNIKADKESHEVIRTLLSINEDDKSVTFAGDVPEGYSARLMKPDLDVLIDGAGKAATAINRVNDKTALGLVVSCVGRKLVMNQLIDDELEAVEEVLGENVQLCGFYSYGEIAPFEDDIVSCQLHNQTMTLTVIYES